MSLNLEWWLGRCSILLYNGEKIGEITSKTFEEKYGTLDKWLRQVHHRSTKRLKKIDEQMSALEEERGSLKRLVEDVSMEISYG